jgi:hypothetical protein
MLAPGYFYAAGDGLSIFFIETGLKVRNAVIAGCEVSVISFLL